MYSDSAPRVFRRLLAAEGYLELGMPQHALEELDAVEHPGPFEPPLQFMRGEALRAQERYEDAIQPLQLAAKLIPPPHNRQAWLALSDCFRHRGHEVLADVAEMFADAQPESRRQAQPTLTINITIGQPQQPEGENEAEEN